MFSGREGVERRVYRGAGQRRNGADRNEERRGQGGSSKLDVQRVQLRHRRAPDELGWANDREQGIIDQLRSRSAKAE